MLEPKQPAIAPVAAAKPKVAAVVTMQFRGRQPTRTIKAVEVVCRAGATECILQADRKDPFAMSNARAALEALANDLQRDGVTSIIQEVDIYSTARRWYYGLELAFRDPGTVAALLFPGDLHVDESGQILPEDQVELLRQMVAEADAFALHLADYRSHDEFKEKFDTLVTWPLLELLYPDEAKEARALKTSKMRTEISLVGRLVFEDFVKNSYFSWGTDPTPQVLLHALRQPHLRVKAPAHLDRLADDDNARRAIGQAEQIVRFVDQMVYDRIIESEFTVKGTECQLAAYDRLRGLVEQASALKLRSLDRNRRRLAPAGGIFRAAYAIPDGIPLHARLQALYEGSISNKDPLSRLLHPVDQRGEVNAWGGPHLTVTDALTMQPPEEFSRVVIDVCRGFDPPVVTPKGLTVWGGTALVLGCESPELESVRAALAAATRSCIERSPLTDEEIQRAQWWIRQRGHQAQDNLEHLNEALRWYAEAGSPPLPASRHFRLGFLVRLAKELHHAKPDARSSRERALFHFLHYGEPPWYATASSLHLSLASGLVPETDTEKLKRHLEPSVLADFPSLHLSRLAIMGEDPISPVTVRFFDWLTETPVEEVRPGFRVIAWAEFRRIGT